MKTFGKAVRNSLPALGLGLASAFGVVAIAASTAPAAVAQIKAKKEFVENFNAASEAVKTKQWQMVIDKTNAAQPHATDNQQKLALEQLRVVAYASMKNNAALIKSIETALALNPPPELVKNYKGMLAGAYAETGNEAKALELTKEYIDQYGGDSNQYAYLAKNALDAKDFNTASSYAQKAIEQAEKEGKPLNGTYYNILLNAYAGGNNLDDYYKTLERVAPILNKEIYWRPLIERAKKEPKYKSTEALLDVYRTLEAAKVALKPQEQQEMGEIALNAGMAIESERVLAPLFKAGTLGGAGDPNAERNKKFYAKAQSDAQADKTGGLAQSEKEAAAKPTGEVYIRTGESYLGAGDYTKAAELIRKGLDKGSLEPGVAELAKLRLGIAQMKSGQKEEARKTWSEVKGDNGSAWLAKVWTALSKV